MAVTMNDVKAFLDAEEPDYAMAVNLGADAHPHLQALVSGDDPMLGGHQHMRRKQGDIGIGHEFVKAFHRKTKVRSWSRGYYLRAISAGCLIRVALQRVRTRNSNFGVIVINGNFHPKST